MRRTLVIPATLIVLGLALTGCSASSMSGSDTAGSAPMSEEMLVAPDSSGGEALAPTQSLTDRQVITTGWVTITVEKPLDAAADAVRIAESAGGRVDARTEYAPSDGDQGSATLTLRLPADTLSATLDELKELGQVREVSLNAADVTMQSQDLDARIDALSTSVDRLLALLAAAESTDTLIQLETAISDRQGQLESLESQRRYLADQVALSTVTLNLESVATAPVDEPVTFVDGLVAGWNSFVTFFAGLIVVIGVLLPWLVFLGILAAVVIVIVKRRRERRGAPLTLTPPAPAEAAEAAAEATASSPAAPGEATASTPAPPEQ